jgi:hypothetical protein
MKSKRTAKIVCTTLPLLLVGCSGHLSRSAARSQVEHEINAGMPGFTGHEMLVQVGRIAATCFDQVNYDPVENSQEYKALASTGFATVTSEGKSSWSVVLTEPGKRSLKGEPYAHKVNGFCDYSQVTLPLSTFDQLEIQEILEDGPHARADIAFTWKVTPLGLALKKEATRLKLSDLDSHLLIGKDLTEMQEGAITYKTYDSVLFDKFDDGWKLRL